MSSYLKRYIVGSYKDELLLFKAIKKLQENSVTIDDVYTPYPVHGLDHALGLRQTRLHTAGFIYGAIGLAIILSFMSWVMVSDWPINYGGKPFWAMPAFVPMAFEFTVLCASVGMFLTFCYLCRLAPTVKKHHFHIKATDDMFVIVVDVSGNTELEKKVKKLFKNMNALEVNVQRVTLGWWFGSYGSKQRLYEENGKKIVG